MVDLKSEEKNLKPNGKVLNISRSKTEQVQFDFREREHGINIPTERKVMDMNVDEVDEIEMFKYLGFVLPQKDD